MIVVDMGRPDRFLYTIIYGRLQSPILWDVLSLSTYLAGSVLFLYLPLIPDFAILRDQGARFAPWRAWLYEKFALGWRGTPDQHHRLERAMTVMSVAIIPVAVSIHTVTAWIFGMTLRPGWHSTIIGPDFVVGALYSGIAAVISIMAILRRVYRLENHVTIEHFRKLSLLLLVAGIAYMYFVVNEYMGAVYTNEKAEHELVQSLFRGNYAVHFWTMAGIGLVLPCVLLALPVTRTITGIVTASVLVNIGMWIKRFIIVVPTLSEPFLPVTQTPGKHFGYVPTWVEWAISVGGFACFSLLYAAFSKLVPVVSLWETQATHERIGQEAQRASLAEQNLSCPKSTAGLVVLIGVAAIAFTCRPLLAAEAAPTNAVASAFKPVITLKLSTEEGKKVIVATVKTNDRPVEGAKVAILVKRTFGELSLGAEATLDDGTAAVPFPDGLPGDAEGRLQVIAELQSPKEFAGARVEAALAGGRIIPPEKDPFPRALWAPRAPLVLVATIFILLGAVWSTYAYVVVQLIQIKKKKATNP
jgi:molybdopterin-containing oxidoreductase family membrane subunit